MSASLVLDLDAHDLQMLSAGEVPAWVRLQAEEALDMAAASHEPTLDDGPLPQPDAELWR